MNSQFPYDNLPPNSPGYPRPRPAYRAAREDENMPPPHGYNVPPYPPPPQPQPMYPPGVQPGGYSYMPYYPPGPGPYPAPYPPQHDGRRLREISHAAAEDIGLYDDPPKASGSRKRSVSPTAPESASKRAKVVPKKPPPISRPVMNRRGRGPGARNYTSAEIDMIVSLAQKNTPTCSDMWEELAAAYNRWTRTQDDRPQRKAEALKEKLEKLAKTPKPTGSGQPSRQVAAAQKAWLAIEKACGVTPVDDSRNEYDEGGLDAESNDRFRGRWGRMQEMRPPEAAVHFTEDANGVIEIQDSDDEDPIVAIAEAKRIFPPSARPAGVKIEPGTAPVKLERRDVKPSFSSLLSPSTSKSASSSAQPIPSTSKGKGRAVDTETLLLTKDFRTPSTPTSRSHAGGATNASVMLEKLTAAFSPDVQIARSMVQSLEGDKRTLQQVNLAEKRRSDDLATQLSAARGEAGEFRAKWAALTALLQASGAGGLNILQTLQQVSASAPTPPQPDSSHIPVSPILNLSTSTTSLAQPTAARSHGNSDPSRDRSTTSSRVAIGTAVTDLEPKSEPSGATDALGWASHSAHDDWASHDTNTDWASHANVDWAPHDSHGGDNWTSHNTHNVHDTRNVHSGLASQDAVNVPAAYAYDAYTDYQLQVQREVPMPQYTSTPRTTNHILRFRNPATADDGHNPAAARHVTAHVHWDDSQIVQDSTSSSESIIRDIPAENSNSSQASSLQVYTAPSARDSSNSYPSATTLAVSTTATSDSSAISSRLRSSSRAAVPMTAAGPGPSTMAVQNDKLLALVEAAAKVAQQENLDTTK
ncbi:hypothetical protein B0H21DRAFT_823051 [Amylocystis lapponica]|nr:hypothetical protein B0H21DRAFT_823051 [Amylocystis lapponica]